MYVPLYRLWNKPMCYSYTMPFIFITRQEGGYVGGTRYVQEVGTPQTWIRGGGYPPLLLIPGGSHQMYGRQVGGTHRTGMHS